ncbi:unnamed protein product [Caenorhabditis bovis]|uniref:Uncharacterized protein n=1 Tax=Caenorhabditis bovis TaxID=2654633 RepID=A0A8S1EVV0_9PELO|nr:unnamed protein product [Caenorhabditis bovis]
MESLLAEDEVNPLANFQIPDRQGPVQKTNPTESQMFDGAKISRTKLINIMRLVNSLLPKLNTDKTQSDGNSVKTKKEEAKLEGFTQGSENDDKKEQTRAVCVLEKSFEHTEKPQYFARNDTTS